MATRVPLESRGLLEILVSGVRILTQLKSEAGEFSQTAPEQEKLCAPFIGLIHHFFLIATLTVEFES